MGDFRVILPGPASGALTTLSARCEFDFCFSGESGIKTIEVATGIATWRKLLITMPSVLLL
jgi:hypothetical protein